MGKTQAKGGISLQQACSTIINETSKRLARVMQHAWGNVAYIETQQIHSLRWVGRLVRGRWRFKPLTSCAVGLRREGVALTPGKSQGGRSKEPKTGSKDRYKRKRKEGAKGKESMDHEGNRGVDNSEGSSSDSERTRIEHKRKGHLRHGHQQLVHTSQRDHKPTNHTQMDVLPAHLNRDSFRDSFKGLVALEITIDLPIGFPINNIISHQ